MDSLWGNNVPGKYKASVCLDDNSPGKNKKNNMINGNYENKYATKNKDPGWDTTLPAETRRNLMLKAHRGNELAAAQALKTLANITRDKETRQLAATDAVYFFKIYQNRGIPHVASEPLNNGQRPEKEEPHDNQAE
jgi:hypothetical protein